MSAWGAPPPSSAWASQAEEKDASAAPGEKAVAGVESFPVLGAKEEAFPTLGAAKAGGKKTKKQTMSLAEFTASPSPSPASGGGYRAPSARSLAVDDSNLVLPTGPRARADGEEEQRPSLGGAFRDYGGERGDRYGGGREYGDREERRRGGFGDREDGGRVPDGPSRADEDRDWGASKRFVPSGPGNDRRGGDAGPPPGPSRADEDRDWGASKRNAPPPPPPAQGKDPRVEDLKQFHTVDRAQTEEEKRLKDELEAAEAAAKADGADAEAQAKARDLALKLAKLTLELDDKVRFATAHAKENGHGPSSNGAAGPAAGKTDNKWRKADPASNGHAEA